MAQPLRIEYPGAHYHVISRGNERRPIVRDDADREKRLDWLRRTVETYGWRLHSFVQMDNHDHLFAETPQPNLSAGMQFLNGSDWEADPAVPELEALRSQPSLETIQDVVAEAKRFDESRPPVPAVRKRYMTRQNAFANG